MPTPPTPGIFSGVLVCSDVDGTLGENGVFPPENCAAIRRFQEQGGLFTVATGRHPHYLRDLAHAFVPNAPLVVVNGAVVYDLETEQTLFAEPLPLARAQALVRDVVARFPCLESLDYCALHHGRKFSPAEAAALPDDYRIEDGPDGRVQKIIFIGHEGETISRLQAALAPATAGRDAPPPPLAGGFAFSRSWPVGLEMNAAAAGKAAASRWLARRLTARLLVAIGNYDNDAEMLRAADLGYAMGDSSPAALAAAPCHTPPWREGGVAWALADLERRLRAGELGR